MDIKKLWGRVQNVLPLVYDDSLSYYEFLGKVVNKINEIIDNINGGFIDYVKEEIDELLSGALFRSSDKTVVISETEGTVVEGENAEAIQIGNIRHKISGTDVSLKGKDIVFFGDSWTVGGSASVPSLRFSTIAAGKLGMVERNFGVGASGFCIPNNEIISQVITAGNTMTDAEKAAVPIVVFIGGVNDWRHRGDYNISSAIFNSAVLSAVLRAKSTFPNAKIYVGISNATRTGMTDGWRNFITSAQNYIRRASGLDAIVMQWVAERTNYNSDYYRSDDLHLTDLGHSVLAGHIVQYILGGTDDINYYYGTLDVLDGVALEFSGHLFREGYDAVLIADSWTFTEPITENTLVGSVPDDLKPRTNLYIPIYRGNVGVGTVCITYSGNIRVTPNSGQTIPNGFTPTVRWPLNAP